jgi:hypothetical protein
LIADTIGLFDAVAEAAAARFGSGARLLCSEMSAEFFCSTFFRVAKTSSF